MTQDPTPISNTQYPTPRPRGTVGRYQLRAELGAGGFATVYRAYDPVLDREVALKVLHPHLAREAATRERFVREGRALARVQHPNVVPIFDAGETDGAAYLAMALIEGRTLSTVVQHQGPLSLEDAVAVAGQVASALEALHARNLVHRDVKPSNILIEHDGGPAAHGIGRAVLLDFGIARALDGATVTTDTALVGTPGFMAPEQVDPAGRTGPQTDVYQLGATVYAVLAGRPPYEGDVTRAIYAIMHRPPPDLRVARPDLPAAVSDVITRSLDKDPRRRPHGPAALAAELRAAATGRPIRPRVPPTVPMATGAAGDTRLDDINRGAAAPADAGAGFAATRRAPSRERRAVPEPPPSWGMHQQRPRRRGGLLPLLLAGGGIVVAGAVAAGVLLWPRSGGEADQARVATAGPAAATVAVQPSPPPTPSAQPSPATATPGRTATPAAAAASPAATPTAAGGQPAGAMAVLLRETMAGRGYTPDGPVVQTPAGAGGGTLTVQKGVCQGTGDGYCQMLFIFLDQRFLGTDWVRPSTAITEVRAAGAGRFTATYADYAAGDPTCCPSRPPVTITFTWDGSRLRPNAVAPGHGNE